LVIIVLGRYFELNAMRYYFVLAVVLLPVFLLLLWRFSSKHQFGMLVQFVRIIILLGVISLPLLRITI
jgi:4-hydroxybenzoate polyprenyltransferase